MNTVDPGTAAGPVTLAQESRRFLCRDTLEASHRVYYGRSLAGLTEVVGTEADVAAVTIELEDDLLRRCDHLGEFAPGVRASSFQAYRPSQGRRRTRCSVSSRSPDQ